MKAAVLLAAGLALAACAEPATHDPLAPEQVAPTLTITAAPKAPVLYRINGGGTAHDDFSGGVNNAHVNVVARADGTVEGSFTIQIGIPPGQDELDQGLSGKFDAVADCVEVEGDLAWISGTLTTVRDAYLGGAPIPVPGDPQMVVIQDSGPGQFISFFAPPAFWGVTDCQDKPSPAAFFPPPPFITLNGNMTIHRY